MFIVGEIVNIAELTILANTFFKKGEIIKDIMHDKSYEYNFTFENGDVVNSPEDWVEKLKSSGAEDMHFGFNSTNNIERLGYLNATPAGIICKYSDGKVTRWLKRWSTNEETKNYMVTYVEKECPTDFFNKDFVNSFEKNFEHFKNTLVKMQIFSEKFKLKYWAEYFQNALELENIDKAKELSVTKILYGKIPDTNLCVYAMAMQAYPFGGMGSWCDEPLVMARALNMESAFVTISRNLFSTIMGMLAYATTNI